MKKQETIKILTKMFESKYLQKKQLEKELKQLDKAIMISDDDEGNGFHYLWYTFSSLTDAFVREDEVNEEVAKYEDTIILG